MLTVEGVTVTYDGKPVVENASFTLDMGQWLMIAGPNGAGKTSLLRAVTREVPYQGRITLKGKDLRRFKSRELAREVAVLSQAQRTSYAFTVEEVVAMGRYAYGGPLGGDPEGKTRVEEALEKTGLAGIRNQSVLTLSGGQAQRVALARVLAQNPSILVLDEPVNHLDLPYQKQFLELILEWLQAPGRAVLSVMHDVGIARRYGTHGLLMRDGVCAAMGPVEAALDREALKRVYGMDVFEWTRMLYQPFAENRLETRQKTRYNSK